MSGGGIPTQPRDLGTCDFCGRPIGFYGCPRHGTDCYVESDEGENQ